MKRAAALLLFLGAVVVALPVIGAGSAAGRTELAIGRVHASYQPTNGKIYVLAIGNDARSGNPFASRADAIHLIGINTKTMKAGILNFPRDSWVDIPGHGTNKINAALYDGGPQLLATTVERLTGIHIDYWVMVGFEGFQGIVKDLNGVRMHVPTDLSDPGGSGVNLRAGTQNLQGPQALAYMRARHPFANGDITRTFNQGRFLVALLAKLRRQVGSNPAELLRWIAITREHARFDIAPEEMFRLGILASQLSPRAVHNVTVPVSIGQVGAASVVFIQESGARPLYARLRKNASL